MVKKQLKSKAKLTLFFIMYYYEFIINAAHYIIIAYDCPVKMNVFRCYFLAERKITVFCLL